MVKVNLIGFDRLLKRIEVAPANLKKEIGAEIQFAAEDFRERAIIDAPADVGFLRGQITVNKLGELTAEVISGSKYSAPMEFGTKTKFQPIPGIDAGQFKGQPAGGTWKDFVANIKNWVRRKGIPATAAYPITRSIYRFGVKPHPFFFKQIGSVRKQLLRRVLNVLKDTV
jgi:hypothetical protein